MKIIIWLYVIIQPIGFGILAILAELNGADWLAIVFAILCFLTLSVPGLAEAIKRKEEE